VLGASGALLFVLTPGWTYADAVRRAVGAGLTGTGNVSVAPALLAGLATLVGAVAAGIVARRFTVERPTWIPVLRSLLGGALMATGAIFVPGGNDNLLLWSVPGASISGLLAYLIMSALIIGFLGLKRLGYARKQIPA